MEDYRAQAEKLRKDAAECALIRDHVFRDNLVNLTVFDSNDIPHGRTSVPLVQEDEAKPEHGYFCEWMPYQVGQAAKHAK